jgi:hypothetical protein
MARSPRSFGNGSRQMARGADPHSSALTSVNTRLADRLIDAARILELANKAHFLYLRQDPFERAKLPRIVVSNWS